MDVIEAETQLKYCRLKGGRLLKKTLNSAVANAQTVLDANKADLRIHEVKVDAGPIIKRSKPRNKGGRVPIMKRTSHFTVVVAAE